MAATTPKPGPYHVGPLLRISAMGWGTSAPTLPVNTPDYLHGYVDQRGRVTFSPHGFPNCNAGDPVNPELCDERVVNQFRGYTGSAYIVGWQSNDNMGHVLCDLQKAHTDPVEWGVGTTLGAECISLAAWIRKDQLPGPVIGQDVQGSYQLAFTNAAPGTWNWQHKFYSGQLSEPTGMYLHNASLPTTGENPLNLTWSVPVGEVATAGVVIGFLKFGSLHSPRAFLSNQSGQAVDLEIQADASHRHYFAIVSRPGGYVAGQTTYTINAWGYGTPHTTGQPLVPETATLTINWTA